MTSAMRSLPGISSNTGAQFLGQYLAETQYVVASRYPAGGTSFYGWYQSPLINLETVLTSEFNTATSDNQLAVTKILKAYFFWHVTDRWGDVPYSEALKGGDNITPAYDTQESIYDDLFALLEEADGQIDESGSISGDIVYGGDMAKWKNFGNTVRLLMALRLSEVNASKASAEFNAALTAGVMESNDDSFVYQHLADADNQNYWYGQVVESSRNWWALTETLVDIMDPVDDPRLAVYGEETETSGGYIGLPIGSDASNQNVTDFSLLGEDIHQQDSPVYLVTYAQALFAQAEAAELGWTTEDAGTNYNAAIEASIDQWTGSTADAAAFLAQPDIVYDGTVEQIATQRYVHLFMNGYEGWAEWRRTGFPAFVPSDGNEVPTRQSYTADESFNNTANYEAAIDRQFGGDNDLYGQVWWDVN
ncbi:MAG: SusD/RagB family nutrient-binding outer membrane lipoprotein, partial [Balneolaceae bacterium]